MKDLKAKIEYNRLLGEFIGTLKGILLWEIPSELRKKISRQLKELENYENT